MVATADSVWKASGTAISCLGFAGLHRLLGGPFVVGGKSQEAHEVNEPGGWVKISAKFTGRVVEGNGVVVIVEAPSPGRLKAQSSGFHYNVFIHVCHYFILPCCLLF